MKKSLHLPKMSFCKKILFTASFLTLSYTLTAQAPHSVGGTITYQNGSSPSSATCIGYILGRPTETQVGTYYPGSGAYQISFESSFIWDAGETFHVDIDDGAGGIALGEVMLTYDPVDVLNIVITPPSPPAPIIGTIIQPTCSVATGSVDLNGLPSSGTWTLTRYPGAVTSTGTGTSTTVSGLNPGTYYFTVTSEIGGVSDPSADVIINEQPVVPDQPGTISGPAAVCEGASETYSISPVEGATSYNWTLPPGWSGSSSSNSISVTVGASGGDISVSASNACGTSTSRTLSVSVSSIPDQPGSISGSTTVCEGSSETYSISEVSGASSYTWTLPSGWTGGSSSNSITTTIGADGGTISVEASNTCGTSSARTLSVSGSSLPDQPGSISGPTTVCEGATETYSISPVSGATSYTWTLPSGWTGSSTSTSISATAVANGGTVTVRANNSCGSGTTRDLNVSVATTPDQPGSISGDVTVCEGATETYSVSPVSGATSYNWTFPSGWSGSSTTNSISVIPGSNGGTISVTASNTCGTSTARTLSVDVSALPDQPGTIGGDASVCEGSSQTYSISPVSGATSYTWALPSGWSGSSTSTSITATVGASSGNVAVRANNSCGAGPERTLSVSVTEIPSRPGSISGDASVCEGSTETYSVSPVSGATSYTWTLPSGWTGSSTSNSITVTAGASGGTISVRAENSCGNSDTRSLSVSVATTPDQPGSISGDVTVCEGSSQTYNISPVSGATSYIWTLPSGWSGSSTSTSITTTVGASGGTISVRASNDCGTSSSRILSVSVTELPNRPGTISGDVSVCEGSNQIYTIAPVSGATSYTWTLPSGWTGSSTSTSITTTVGASSGEVSVRANNACGSGSARTLDVSVTALPARPGSISGDGSVCENSTETYSVSPVSDATSYTWTLPSGWTGSSSSNSINVTTGVNGGTISVRANNSCGTSSSRSLSVTVVETPTPPVVGAITQPTCAVATGSVVLSGLPSPWTLRRSPGGNVYTGSGSSTTISGIPPGTFTFIVRNSTGCESASSDDVVINANPSSPAAPQVGSITQPTCDIGTGGVVLNGLPASGTWTLTRSPGSVSTTGTGTSTEITGLEPGTYTFIVTDDVQCASVPSDDVVINDQPPTPTAPVIGEITQPDCDTVTGSIMLEGLPATGTWMLTINPGGATVSGTGLTTTLTELDPETYTFTVTNEEGCTSDLSNSATINSHAQTPPTPIITLEGDVLHSDSDEGNQWYYNNEVIEGATNQDHIPELSGDYFVIVTLDGCTSDTSNIINFIIDGISVSGPAWSTKIYPNPVSDELFIEVEGYQERLYYEILNVVGQSVSNGQFTEKTTVYTGNLQSGMYLIKLGNGEDSVIRKIIKNQ